MSWEGVDFAKKIKDFQEKRKNDRMDAMRRWVETKIQETHDAMEKGEIFFDSRSFKGVTCEERDKVANEFIQRNPSVKEIFKNSSVCDYFRIGFFEKK